MRLMIVSRLPQREASTARLPLAITSRRSAAGPTSGALSHARGGLARSIDQSSTPDSLLIAAAQEDELGVVVTAPLDLLEARRRFEARIRSFFHDHQRIGCE